MNVSFLVEGFTEFQAEHHIVGLEIEIGTASTAINQFYSFNLVRYCVLIQRVNIVQGQLFFINIC